MQWEAEACERNMAWVRASEEQEIPHSQKGGEGVMNETAERSS